MAGHRPAGPAVGPALDRLRPASRPWPWFIATGSLALTGCASWSDLLLVVAGHIVPGWVVTAVLLAASLLLLLVLGRLHRSRRSPPPPKRARLRLVHRLLATVAALGTAWGACSDLALGARYYTLRPAVAGCEVIVRETSWLMIGGGEAYTVGRTGIAWGASGSWTVDDGYRPVADGNHLLEWGRTDGSLTVGGTATDPVLDGGVIGIDCS